TQDLRPNDPRQFQSDKPHIHLFSGGYPDEYQTLFFHSPKCSLMIWNPPGVRKASLLPRVQVSSNTLVDHSPRKASGASFAACKAGVIIVSQNMRVSLRGSEPYG